MSLGTVIIIDNMTERKKLDREKLRARGYEVIEDESEITSIAEGELGQPDLALLRLGMNLDLYRTLTMKFSGCGTFVVPFVQRDFSSDFRKEILALKADGFINDELPADEWIASVDALIRKKREIDALKREIRTHGTQEMASKGTKSSTEASNGTMPLRDRSPEVYQEILGRYEEGVKLVLRHRIYKITDDIFEPFRQIAKQLFLAKATARDAVQLHYQTLRKIAPTPDSPGAQAYLEVGRTTIVGLMGDLLTYYRDAREIEAIEMEPNRNGSPERATKQL